MPAISTGCATCRKRKIRCDETRPGCNRCKTHNVPCPGYRLPAKGQVFFQNDTSATIFHAHNAYKTKAVTTTVTPISPPDASTALTPGSSSSSRSNSTDFLFSDPLLATDIIPPEWNVTIAPTYLPSPAAERALIYSTFMDVYLPKFRMQDKDAHFSFLQHLISTPVLRGEVSDALDALSMAAVGSTYGDKALQNQAVRAYSRSLGGLSRTLAKKDGGLGDDYVLATVNLLANCEFFDTIAQLGDGWTKHLKGQHQLLAARGPAAMTSRLSLLVFLNMRHGALSHALIMRKATFMGTPEWRIVAWRAPYVDSATILYDSALQVPALLERSDNLNPGSSEYLPEMDRILTEARRLRDQMRSWFHDYDKESKFRNIEDDSLYWLTKIGNFPTFTSLCSDRTVSHAYMFPSFLVGYLLSVYWNTMYFLQNMVQKLHIKRHAIYQGWIPGDAGTQNDCEPPSYIYSENESWIPGDDEAVTEDELMSYVMDMCRCFPFFCEPISSSIGKIALFLPLYTASMHFMQHGHWQMLKWVGNVRDNAFNAGLQPPRVNPQAATVAMMGKVV